eukprot:Pgem_evm2s20119
MPHFSLNNSNLARFQRKCTSFSIDANGYVYDDLSEYHMLQTTHQKQNPDETSVDHEYQEPDLK